MGASETRNGKPVPERDTAERAGLGLLARFIGAVFLVLLGGLLLLDRALVRVNQTQATLDAQSAGLLTEAFLSAQSGLLDQAADAVIVLDRLDRGRVPDHGERRARTG